MESKVPTAEIGGNHNKMASLNNCKKYPKNSFMQKCASLAKNLLNEKNSSDWKLASVV